MKINHLVFIAFAMALVFGSCENGKKNDNLPEISGITIKGKVTDMEGNPIAGLRITAPERTRAALNLSDNDKSLQDSIENAEKDFVKWEGDTGEIIIPDTIFTNAQGEYQLSNKKAGFDFTGELPLTVIDESGIFSPKTETLTVSGSDYKPAEGYKAFASKNLDFKVQPAE